MVIRLIDPKKRKWRIFFWFNRKQIKRIYIGDKRGAENYAAKLRAEVAESGFFPEKALARLTFAHVSDRFMKEYARYKKSGDKLAIYVRRANLFFNGKRLVEITPYDIQQFRAELALTMVPVSVNHYHRAVRRVIYWAADIGLFKGDNPASGKKVKFENERKYWRTQYLEPDQMKLLLDVADDRIKPIILTAVCSGLRLSELKNLTVKDVNLDNCTLYVRESKNDEPGSVPIPELLFNTLAPIIKSLPNQDARVLDFRNFEGLWTRARDRSGLIKIHFHDLRHTYASQIMKKEKNLKVVQELLRHKDFRMTLRYAHLAPGPLRTAALTLDDTFANLRPQSEPKTEPAGCEVSVPAGDKPTSATVAANPPIALVTIAP